MRQACAGRRRERPSYSLCMKVSKFQVENKRKLYLQGNIDFWNGKRWHLPFLLQKSDLKQQNRPLRTDFGLIFLKRACLKKPVFLENLLVHVSTRLFFVSTRLLFIRTSFSLAGALFGCFSALALIVHQVIQFLLPRHIAFPRFVVRKIPLPLAFDILCSLGCGLVGRKVFEILLDRLLGYIPILIEYIKILSNPHSLQISQHK